MIIETINKQIDRLLDELNKTENIISDELLIELEKFADTVIENIEDINNYEIEKYIKEVYKEKEEVNINQYIKNLNSLKQFILLKQNSEPGLFELNDKQIEFIKKVCADTKQFVKSKKEAKENNNKISIELNKYQAVANKFNNKSKLNNSDVEIISEIIGDYPDKEKVEILREILKYNIDLEKSKIKVQSIKIEEVIEKLKEYEPSKEKQIKTQSKKYEDEILKHIDFDKADQIIEFFKEKKILKKFRHIEDLITILLYGNLDSVKYSYEELNKNGLLDKKFVYEFPGLWTIQQNKTTSKKNTDYKENTGENGNPPAPATLKDKVNILNISQLYEKINLYMSAGVDPFENEDECISLFIAAIDTIKKNIETFKKYNVRPNSSSYVTGRTAIRCDQLIECDLLNPFIDHENIHSYNMNQLKKAYANIQPSFLTMYQPGHILIIQTILEKAKDLDDETKARGMDNIFSKKTTKNGYPCLKKDFRMNFLGLNLSNNNDKKDSYDKRIEVFKKHMDLVNTDETNLERYKEMENVIKDYNNTEFKDETYESPFIKEMDKKYIPKDRLEDYYYIIEGRKISRYKVLRLYESLQEYNKQYPEKQFSEEDIRVFAVTYGTYFKSSTYDKVVENINNIEKENDKSWTI